MQIHMLQHVSWEHLGRWSLIVVDIEWLLVEALEYSGIEVLLIVEIVGVSGTWHLNMHLVAS